ncbi:MAG: hypothetical protein JO166_20510 [Deltaproteobacteria bacterium]|nr:hypothetical protein [Deltaproteobacteria bacterium]
MGYGLGRIGEGFASELVLDIYQTLRAVGGQQNRLLQVGHIVNETVDMADPKGNNPGAANALAERMTISANLQR